MRFVTRTFIWTFFPFAIMLTGVFWAIQYQVILSVREELQRSLRQTQASFVSLRSQSELQNSRFLIMVGENATLKAGLQLTIAEPRSLEARRTLEEQLREISEALHFDFLLASTPEGLPLAGVMRVGEQLVGIDLSHTKPPLKGFYTAGNTTYQIASVRVDQGDDSLGVLSVGDHFDFAQFTTPAVLTRNGKVLKSNLNDVDPAQLEAAIASCPVGQECQMTIKGESYISLSMSSLDFGDGYSLRSLHSVDASSGHVQSILRNVFLVSGCLALGAALIVALYSSRSIVRPLGQVVTKLQASAQVGYLPEFVAKAAPVLEIRELMESFNHAAVLIRESQENLRRAYFEFIGSLASALDARDRYTAGHSRRVSERSVAIANAMKLDSIEIEDISIGALLHDIGKIGITDNVLQKPGRLTDEEFALIKQHPTIGRRILEGVHGFKSYLPVVELHHENWDGTGYPLALSGKAVPISARIVHVVDAYDAMTSSRPYRAGMSHEEAMDILKRFAGTQFDPDVVDIFARLDATAQLRPDSQSKIDSEQINRLAEALGAEASMPTNQGAA